MYKKFQSVIIVLLFTITKVNLQKIEGDGEKVGDSCMLPNNKVGRCLNVYLCPGAQSEIISGSRPVTCGFYGKEPIICCDTLATSETQSKSEKKCKDYAKQLEGLRVNVQSVGGTNASSTEFPHMAAIGSGSKDNIQWKCSGSLISDRFVLTVAHCSSLEEIKFVRLGGIKLDEVTEDTQDFEVRRVILHPDYKSPASYYDIALIELDKPAKFSHYVKPACLYTKSLEPEDILSVSGWGRTEDFTLSVNLRKATIELFNKTECDVTFKTYVKRRLPDGILGDRQICAGPREARDVCQGGAPLQFFMNDEQLYSIFGVSSFGKACGISDLPSVYSRVSYYVPWIESVVWP